MSVIKHRDYILEAIDQLRRRKARPDRERICSYVSRKFGVDNRSLIADLERLVDEQIVIKVEYKGNISYRNAAKWSKLSVHKSRIEVELSDLNKLESMQSESERMSYVLRCAITELICRDPDYLDNGVPVYELEQFLTTKDSEFFARISFNVLLSREAKAGTVVKLDNGNYLLGPSTMCASSPSGSEDGHELNMSNDELDDSAFDDSPVKTPPNDLNGTTEDAEDVGPAPEFPPEQPDPDPQPEPPEPEPDPEPDPAMNHKEQEENTGYRLGERRKRAKKKVFDPSDNNLPKAKRRAKPPPAVEKTVKSPPVSHASVASTAHTTAPGHANGPSTNKAVNGTSSNRTSNGPSSHRSSNGPSAHRAQNGSSGRSSNGPGSQRSSNGPATNRENNQIKVDTKLLPSGNKLNSIGTGSVSVCAICISAIVDGKAIQCKDCTQKAHFSCLIRGNRARFRPNSWQCMMCKTCQICSLTEEAGTLVVCTNCDEGYHVKCHIPKPKIPWKKWMCYRCAPPEPKQATPEKSLISVASRLEAAMSSYNDLTVNSIMKTLPKLLEPKIEEMEVEESKLDETIPDASEWSTDDVFEFFSSKYPEYATVFKDQDIDGRSLLLMTRSDVVNGLKLKLGPALKIFGQVKKLQLRRDSPHLLWE